MRWHDQLEAKQREGQLPGLGDAVTRTFDAPEALDTRFHEIHAKSVLNRVPGAARLPFGWTVNTYRGCRHACVYCFARPTHEYLDLNAGEDFDRQILVKVNAPEVLRAELRKPSWTHEHIALGTNTDPYQWVEKRYRLTRGVLEVLLEARNPCSVLTKSPLLLRDLDLFQELRKVTEFSACLSIPTLDEREWRSTEPGTPHPRKRLEAVARLNAAGIPTGVLIAPLMPGINDSEEQVARLVDACREAGATRVGGQALFLRGSTKDVFMGYLRRERPDLVPLYERLYGTGKGAYLPTEVKQQVEGPLRRRARAYRPELAMRFQRDAGDVPDGPPPLDEAERRFRGYAIAREARATRSALQGGAPDRGVARKRPQARQEALF
jgi:DNA repair photolyase